MSHEHYEDCHLHHFPCALERIRDLECKVAQLENGILEPEWMKRIRAPQGGMLCGEDTQTGGALTHTVTLKLHGPGPTHAHHNDEPPSR